MMRSFKALCRNKNGASVAEFALIFPILIGLTFAIVETANLAWQMQLAGLASKRAVRVAATRSLVTPGTIPDCGVSAVGFAPGTPCSDIPGSASWSITCTASNCGADFDRVIAEIQRIYPLAEAGNIEIELQGAGLGFVGLGRPVPIVTVNFVDLTYDYIVLDAFFGLGSITMPPLSASAPAEDLTNGVGGA